jgi:hypothetical protein
MPDEEIMFGWNSDLDMPSAVHRADRDLIVRGHVLISMVDSTPEVARLSSLLSVLAELSAAYRAADDDVVIDGETLLSLINRGFFTGFDEIWLFAEPPLDGKPPSLRLTSDVRLGQKLPEGIASWMTESGSLAGLGDGDGLNFATSHSALADLWRP